MKIIVSAPGKVNIMGEHAVVYGKPSLLAAINRRLTVTIEDASTTTFYNIPKEVQQIIDHALEVIRKEYKIDSIPPFSLSIESQIPFGYHLGSSAALAVAVVGAVVYFSKKLWNPMEINRLAYEVEKKQHTNPSGGDNTAVTFGGFLWYRKELEFLKSLWQLPFRPPASVAHFFLIKTEKPQETTGEMVDMVHAHYAMHTDQFERIFDENEKQTRRITAALKEGNEAVVMDAMKKGEKTLEDMGVVNENIALFIHTIEKQGGAAKILGGGGKAHGVGFLLCYHHDPKQVEFLCQPLGYSIESIILGEEGVRLDPRPLTL